MKQKQARNNKKEVSDIQDKVVSVNKVSKTVKGGKNFAFSVLVIVGDGKGKVGYGKGKAKEVGDARAKALEAAKKSMIKVPLKEGRTLHHDVKGHFGAGLVVVRSASSGTGIIAGGPMRTIFELLGMKDVVAKSIGTSNPYNMVGATFSALENITSPKQIAAKRGQNISEIVKRRNAAYALEESTEEESA